jgi:phosphoserine phosphatase RsbU/P
MPEAGVPLHRLISRDTVETLFESFSALLDNGEISIRDLNGKILFQLERGDQPGQGKVVEIQPTVPDNPGFPLQVDGQVYGFVYIRQPAIGMPAWLSALITSLNLLIGLGLERRRLARETLDRYREVNLLYRVAEVISGVLDIGKILAIILAEALRAVQARCAVVVLTQLDGYPGEKQLTLGDSSIAKTVVQVLANRVKENERLHQAQIISDPEGLNGFLLCAPMGPQDLSLGTLAVARLDGEAEFTAGDVKLLLALSSQAGFAMDKALLHQHELDRQKVLQELVIGERIQRGLLPRKMPTIEGWELSASYQSANQVGGDFYDITRLRSPSGWLDTWGLLIADVTGKGIPAALMMAFSHAIFQAATSIHQRAGDILAHANQLITEHNRSGLLLTAFYAIIKPGDPHIWFANAGHEPPFLYRAASQSCIELNINSGLLIGARREVTYPEHCIELEPGDALVGYTDGVTEARNLAGEFFSAEKLQETISASGSLPAAQLLDAIQAGLSGFTRGAVQADDITILILKKL